MGKKQRLLCIGLVITVICMNISVLYAGQKPTLKKNSTLSEVPVGITGFPDLVIKQATWSSNPKEGAIVGASSILHIIVMNQGIAAAGASKLKIDCKSLTGTNYPYPLAGMINVQPLGPGKSMTYTWPPASSEKWFAGKYKLDFTADYHFNLVKESNENNNKKALTFTVLAKTDFIKKIKAKPVVKLKKAEPVSKPQLIADIEIVSVSMTNDNPVAGENVIITAKVRNSGAIKSPQVGSTFTFWNTSGGGVTYSLLPTPPVPPLVPGQTTELKIITKFIMLGQNAGVKVEIDKGNHFKETDENNNKNFHYFTVQCKPELAPYDGRKAKPVSIYGDTKPGEPFTATIWVYNNGGVESKAAVLAISGIGLTFTSYDIPPIKATEKIGIPVSLLWAEPGSKNCEIKVDYTNTNSESIENNNAMKLIVNVLSGVWPEGE